MRLLLKDGRCDPTAEDNYALTEAVKNGHNDIVELLNDYVARGIVDDSTEAPDEASSQASKKNKSHKNHKYRRHKSNVSDNTGHKEAAEHSGATSRERRHTLHVPAPTMEASEDSSEDVAPHTPTQKVRNRKALMQQTKQVPQLRPKSVEARLGPMPNFFYKISFCEITLVAHGHIALRGQRLRRGRSAEQVARAARTSRIPTRTHMDNLY